MLYSHRRLSTRSLTVFGTVELGRMGYSRPGAPSITPLDKALALPARSFSYELQRRLVKAAVQAVSGIGSNHCRVDRRCRLQTQSGKRSFRMRLTF